MKKTLALLLVASLAAVFALSGCGTKEEVVEDITIEPEVVEDTEGVVEGDIELPEPDDTIYIDPEETFGRDFDDIHFEYDQFLILDEDVPTLEDVASWLREYPDARLLIEGHCDERGTNEYNMALGEQRALAARRYLVGLGIDSDRLTTISYGEERPIALGSTEDAWAQNRRGHFAVSM